MNRIALFLLTNFAILIVFGVLMNVLGIGSHLTANYELDLNNLLAFSALFGFVGSFISLAMSKWSAKRMMGAKVIEKPANSDEAWLMETVARQAKAAGIGMPEVAIYDAPDMNAFATGMSRNNALVAVSTGLFTQMKRDEVEAVLAHEISHVANGDMITLALVQGVVNTFVIFFSRIVGFFVDKVILRNTRGPGIGYWVTTIIAQIVLSFLASAVVMWFSRKREFRADAGAAALVGSDKMVAALQCLQRGQGGAALPDQLVAFGIATNSTGGWRQYFKSHPPLEERITALRANG